MRKLLTLTLLFLVNPAVAEIVTWEATGTLTEVDTSGYITEFPTAAVGDPFRVVFTFDTGSALTSQDSDATGTRYQYFDSLVSLSVSINGVEWGRSDAGLDFIDLLDSYSYGGSTWIMDGINVVRDVQATGPSAFATVNLLLRGPEDLTVINGPGIPAAPPPGLLSLAQSVLQLIDHSDRILGNIDSLVVVIPNNPPTATPDSATTDEDLPINFALSGMDLDSDPLTFSIATQPVNGTVTLSGNIATITPDPDFNGTDSFTFIVNDGTVDSAPATVSLTVNPVNDPPVADDTSATTDKNTPVDIPLTGSDIDGDPITFLPTAPASNGSVSVSGSIATYTPFPGFSGPDSFTFVADDGAVNSPLATVSITVNNTNSPPMAISDAAMTNEDMMLPITLAGTDPDNDPLTFMLTDAPTQGTLAGTAPNLIYTPDPDYFGPDSLTFIVNDGQVDSAPATVSITVMPVNDAPTAANVSATTDENMSVAVTLMGSDIENDPLSYVVTVGPANGTLSGTAPNLTYLPNPGFTGTDSFSYLVNDGEFDSITASVDVEVGIAPTPDFCYEPSYDRFTQTGTFFWGLCDGSNRFKLRATGGGTTTPIFFEGRLEANGGAQVITPDRHRER